MEPKDINLEAEILSQNVIQSSEFLKINIESEQKTLLFLNRWQCVKKGKMWNSILAMHVKHTLQVSGDFGWKKWF